MQRAALLFFILASSVCVAQEQTVTTVGGFADVYYAYSFAQPPTRDRSFTTQPLRHNEFNINLAMIDVKHQTGRIRGRFAIQTGTYVQSNLALEPPLLRNVLEASVGTRLGDNVWVDLGIFPSHIGLEGIVSKDNWTYSRSLLADYSPYYEAGISIMASLGDNVTVRGLIMNGWQNIAETNDDKALGTQVQYKASDAVLLNWSTFIGNEQPDSSASRLRLFNDWYAVLGLSEHWSLGLVFDLGFQKQATGSSYDSWHAATVMLKYAIDAQWAVAARAEYFLDKYGVIVPTGTPENFQTVAGSVNVDYAPVPGILWRAEIRALRSKDAVYPAQDGVKNTEAFVAVSAAITF